EPAAVRALSALEQAARLRNAKPSGDLDPVGKHSYSSEKVHAAALRLIGTWKLSSYTRELLAIAGNKSQPASLRDASFFSLRELGGSEAVSGLKNLAGKNTDEATRRQAAIALCAVDLRGSLTPIVEIIITATKEDDSLALW